MNTIVVGDTSRVKMLKVVRYYRYPTFGCDEYIIYIEPSVTADDIFKHLDVEPVNDYCLIGGGACIFRAHNKIFSYLEHGEIVVVQGKYI